MSIVERAKELAHRAHAGQVDKAGKPYIEHVARVAARVREDRMCANEDCNGRGEVVDWGSVGCGDPSCCSPWRSPCPDCEVAEAAAWLHDVIEDAACDEQSRIGHHVEDNFPVTVVNAVLALTKFEGYPESNYYADIREDEIAMRVKLADIADNSDEARLALLDKQTADRLRKKYRKALRELGVSVP
ncbi:phosphohydrolase [Pseudoxanthomonas sp. X-1]|uniref:HD domain-containing protein n=1 Tax=Pseudoxanthomonas sp. X-1 TaxID=2571115 RepID=UPI001981A8BD|nr:phosphohydrolase [Pseudoxanthomonas sp. X-1]UAY76804.1 phosphohydrolase [Pseudoxanthomonas sp. X-1]